VTGESPARRASLWFRKARWFRLAVVLTVAGLAVSACLGPGTLNAAPQPAGSFSLPGLARSSQRIALSDYAGKPLIINFFAAWSPPCLSETRLLGHFYRFYHEPVTIIGIDSRDGRTAGLNLVRSSLVGYPVATDPALAVATMYHVPGIPATYFLNSRHQIVMTDYGWLDWKKLRVGVAAIDPGSPAAQPAS
jgi:cytochrome c biogenesis protein CcmG, thiol:disulfide interchange protein DsbE